MNSSTVPEFELVPGKSAFPTVFIPGWASDHRIFRSLPKEGASILVRRFDPFGFSRRLFDFLTARSIGKVSLFGWSLGGFLSLEFARLYPSCTGDVTVIGVRRAYLPDEIAGVRSRIRRSAPAFLRGFYARCLADTGEWDTFRTELLQSYLEIFSAGYLDYLLTYLADVRLLPEHLRVVERLNVYHGQADRIAPLAEIGQLCEEAGSVPLHLIPGAGHLPFFRTEGWRP